MKAVHFNFNMLNRESFLLLLILYPVSFTVFAKKKKKKEKRKLQYDQRQAIGN